MWVPSIYFKTRKRGMEKAPGRVTERDVLATPGAAAFYERLQNNPDTVGLVELVPALTAPTDNEIARVTRDLGDQLQAVTSTLNDHVQLMFKHMNEMERHLQKIADSDVLRDEAPDVLRSYLIDRQQDAYVHHVENRLRWTRLWWRFIKHNPTYVQFFRPRRSKVPDMIHGPFRKDHERFRYVPSLTDPGRKSPSKPVPGRSTGGFSLGFSISQRDPFTVL